MSIQQLLLILLVLSLTGCGVTSGLSRSESLANAHPLFMTAKRDKGEILTQEGLEYLREGSYEKFHAAMSEALSYYDGELARQADIMRYQGKAYLDRNEYDQSLGRYRQSLVAARTSGYADGVVLATIGLADCYKKIGDIDKAIETLTNTSSAGNNIPENGDPRISLSVAELLAIQGHLSQALVQLNSIPINEQQRHIDQPKQAYYSLRGQILAGLGNHREALLDFQQALTLARKTYNASDIVDILNSIGFSQIALQRHSEAARSFQEGIGLLNVMNLTYPERQLSANYGLGLVYRQQRRDDLALRYFATAISYTEELRGRLSSSESRSLFLSNKTGAYEHAIDILVAAKDQKSVGLQLPSVLGSPNATPAEAAFFYAESTKARSFLELLAKGRTDSLADRIPRNLAEQERRLVSTISSIQSSTSGQSDAQQTLLKRSKRELDELIILLRRQYPDYAAIRYPEPVMARSVPLRSNELLLTFKVNADKTYLWILEQGKQPETVQIAIKRDELIKLVAEFRSSIENPGLLHTYSPVRGKALGALLLGQIWPRLAPDKHIIIVPDGILNLIPFEALVADQTTGTGVQYLGDRYRISYYPSASVMAAMRRSHKTVQLTQPFFGLGDPIYEENDPRYSAHQHVAMAETSTKLNLRSVLARNGFNLNRLPETRDELLTIGALFGYQVGNPNIKLDLEASKRNLLQAPLGSYRYVHFATHGLLSGDVPYILEPALVLSQPGNIRPDDGFLKMSEVLEMKLNADAVVLSACKTALGKEVAGEGIVGLSRAFMLAGSRSVIVSLWSVESNSTAVMMKHLYSQLKAGKSKEEALRLAKDALRKQQADTAELQRGLTAVPRQNAVQGNTSHPFYWAPFILIGEWD